VKSIKQLLSGGDLRSIAGSNQVVKLVKNQSDFDQLFKLMLSEERLIKGRAADTIEKITINNPSYLSKYHSAILELLHTSKDKELQWHLATLCARIQWSNQELSKVFKQLTKWALDSQQSKIVRVNAIQALHDLALTFPFKKNNYQSLIADLASDQSPSIRARIRKINQ